MADESNDLLSAIGSSLTGVTPTTPRRPRAAGSTQSRGRANAGPSPNGPRGRRMLAADTPVDSLDRHAPRGTYIDLLV
jgi:hypothetical protein